MRSWSCIFVILVIIALTGIVSADDSYVIGAIIDNKGDSASYAKGIEAAIDQAVSDLNEQFVKEGLNTNVVVKKAMTDGSPEGAVSAAEELIGEGAQIIVEPSSSEEVSAILPVLTDNGVLSINPTTSMALSNPGDPIVRLGPDDQKLLIAAGKFNSFMAGETPTKAVIVSREDLYGRVLTKNLQMCSNVAETVTYPVNTTDFSDTLHQLDTLVGSYVSQLGEKNVVVFAISFDEIADLMAQASAYPNLSKAWWQGMDGVALNSLIIENKTAAEFANMTGLTALSFNIVQPADSDYWRVYDVVKKAAGHQPTIYEILPYDEVFMAAEILQKNPESVNDMVSLAASAGNQYYGATGWLKLNANNDREHGDYFFYTVIRNEDGTYQWKPVYSYLDTMNTIIPLTGVNNTFTQNFNEP